MRLMAVSDMHGDLELVEPLFKRVGPVDVALLAGDLTNFGTESDAEAAVRLAERYADRVFAVAGNCDSAKIDRYLTRLGVSLAAEGVPVGDVGFYGVSATPPWLGTMYEISEQEIAAALAAGREQLQQQCSGKDPLRWHVLLAHAPPYGLKVDRVSGGSHAGSRALLEHIKRHEPAVVVCGHIHEARGIDRVGKTAVVNCGPAFRGYYVVIDLGEDLQINLLSAGR